MLPVIEEHRSSANLLIFLASSKVKESSMHVIWIVHTVFLLCGAEFASLQLAMVGLKELWHYIKTCNDVRLGIATDYHIARRRSKKSWSSPYCDIHWGLPFCRSTTCMCRMLNWGTLHWQLHTPLVRDFPEVENGGRVHRVLLHRVEMQEDSNERGKNKELMWNDDTSRLKC